MLKNTTTRVRGGRGLKCSIAMTIGESAGKKTYILLECVAMFSSCTTPRVEYIRHFVPFHSHSLRYYFLRNHGPCNDDCAEERFNPCSRANSCGPVKFIESLKESTVFIRGGGEPPSCCS